MDFPKNFEFKIKEQFWYDNWLKNDIFKSDNNSGKEPYSIVMPPPNVTGILHFGHVLNHTLQDLYIRRKRMQGYEVCWFPGLDHAGIATQSKVESEIKKNEGLTRYDLGRDEFLNRVWQWKDKYGGIILDQLKKLGVSCDWSRTLFTMDNSASVAVQEAFIRLYEKGLIYKGKRIINWSTLAQTALSDEEVEFKEVQEKLYILKYKLKGESSYLLVATVRPETIYGDVAVAVNPNDKRFNKLVGKKVIVPLVNREVTIIADDYADPEFGTGCVKITPAHDPNDFEIGLRHDLEIINTINPDGTMNEITEIFNGLDRFDARKEIVKKLENENLIEKIEDYTHNVGFSQRGGEPIEPYISDQWFVKMDALAIQSKDMINNADINFYPSHWEKTYNHWMSNIKDWCISRQLWWGHRIPVFYDSDGNYVAARNENEAKIKLGLSSDSTVRQDEDVLDTWFSSWLWPLTTMRWFDDNGKEDLNNETINKFFPTDLLVTGPDIIFFWVARMIMASKEFANEIPFKNVYFTSMIRDGKGRKLSKSLGNSPDPLIIMDKYGADAVRFTMIYLAPLGQDVKMDVDINKQDIPSMEIGRNFVNKIWNAGRFISFKRDSLELDKFDLNYDNKLLNDSDKWIQHKFLSTKLKVEENLENYKVTEYSKTLYEFIWSDFCDWYIEFLKIETKQKNDKTKEKLNFATSIYIEVLKLLHPVMPYVTEELYHLLTGKSDNHSISLEDSKEFESLKNENESFYLIEFLKSITDEVRSLRNNIKGLSINQKVNLNFSGKIESIETLKKNESFIKELAKVENIKYHDDDTKGITGVISGINITLIVENIVNKDDEIARLRLEIERLKSQCLGISKKLSNEKFVNNAPKEIVDLEKKKLEDMENKIKQLNNSLLTFQ